jgi:hypothetical protein
MHAARTDGFAHTLRFTLAPVAWAATSMSFAGANSLRAPAAPLAAPLASPLARVETARPASPLVQPKARQRLGAALIEQANQLAEATAMVAGPRSVAHRSVATAKPRATANKFKQLRGANELLEQQEAAQEAASHRRAATRAHERAAASSSKQIPSGGSSPSR